MKRLLLPAVCLVCASLAAPAMACPDYSIWGNESYEATGSQLYQRRDFRVVAGGENYIWLPRHQSRHRPWRRLFHDDT